MIVTIHQPEFLPWLGFFDRIHKSDVFVILDDVQYQKNAFINRNRIKTAQGWQWLTVPVKARERLKKIHEVQIDNQREWGKTLWKTLFYNYKKAPFFTKYAGFFQESFFEKWELIVDLDIYFIENVLKMLGMKKRIEKVSKMKIEGEGTDRLISICKELGADTYLSGPGGKLHMDLEAFKKERIEVIFQNLIHPHYSQLFPEKGFIPYLSIIDLLFNCGPQSTKIIASS